MPAMALNALMWSRNSMVPKMRKIICTELPSFRMNNTNANDLYPGGSQVHFIRTPTILVACLIIPACRHRALGCPLCRDVRVTQEKTICCYIRQRNNEIRIL
jgi:hypothetical protein